MNKKILYVIITLLVAIILLLLLRPAPSIAPNIDRDELTGETATTFPVLSPAADESVEMTVPLEFEVVTIEGVFIGLEDSPVLDQQNHQLLLINDGSEILSISLWPLLGNVNTNVEAILGVSRGERVTITGEMVDNAFIIQRIEAVN